VLKHKPPLLIVFLLEVNIAHIAYMSLQFIQELPLRPFILNLHGYTSNAQQQQLYSNFMPIADTANFLMVFPNGTFSSGQRFWNAGLSSALVNDIAFLSALIDSLDLTYNINLNQSLLYRHE
jgi:poly(3-hydroxybutyrate) depolymerase